MSPTPELYCRQAPARDDTLMVDYPAAVGDWDLFLPQRLLVVIEHGGHHLDHTRPALLAAVVERGLASLRLSPGP
ncbi:hypothetical protein [Actinoplanes couchii]|uniref:Uncharacterized protein n=1 Tax=Actinoplanes couchii TaxID=403638 RepID=A0ABQ3XRE1_9ACTN|nr:hypothetical protein [Actinoplanes couchii]MDR6320042.1 hypothetical protein [Actinoplanes couchii]GID61082.1 hypothetical protein Aco03nite_094860 [Actinoplanes couchii]